MLLNYMHVCLKKADKPCIVAFDEFQQISKYPEKNIEALLRSHIQHLSNVHFIFSGSERHLVTEMFLSSARPFYNSTSILELYPIVAEEYIPFVCHWFDVADVHAVMDHLAHIVEEDCGDKRFAVCLSLLLDHGVEAADGVGFQSAHRAAAVKDKDDLG